MERYEIVGLAKVAACGVAPGVVGLVKVAACGVALGVVGLAKVAVEEIGVPVTSGMEIGGRTQHCK